jgi:hypothetical protein
VTETETETERKADERTRAMARDTIGYFGVLNALTEDVTDGVTDDVTDGVTDRIQSPRGWRRHSACR